MDKFLKAVIFATNVHCEQKRKHVVEPYIVHPLRVAKFVAKYTDDEATLIAAVLHDTVEENKNVTLEIIENEFGLTVVTYVDELTNEFTKEKYPQFSRAQRKAMETARQAKMSDNSKLIKNGDIFDNIPSIVLHDKEFAFTYVKEKKDFLEEVRSIQFKGSWDEAMSVITQGYEDLKK